MMTLPFAFQLAAFIMLLGLTGCHADDQEAPKTLFDHDHEVPPHWPTDLSDLRNKLQERTEILHSKDVSDRAKIRQELGDLIAWAPEIAADTDLTEQQWIPIHRVSKQLSGRFKSTDWDSNLKQQFDELDDILEQAERTLVAKINDDMDSLSDEVTR